MSEFKPLLRGYLKTGNVNAAQDVFRELEGSGTWDMESLGIAPDAASYTSLMDHWATQGDVVLAEKAGPSRLPDTWNELSSVCRTECLLNGLTPSTIRI